MNNVTVFFFYIVVITNDIEQLLMTSLVLYKHPHIHLCMWVTSIEIFSSLFKLCCSFVIEIQEFEYIHIFIFIIY